jgi:acyl-CoA synthetase (AMP-forming)/AMP-acid ligase II
MGEVMDSHLDAGVLSRIVRREAERDPDRLVLVFENGPLPAERVTAGQLAVRGNQVATALDRAGLQRGDRVAIMLRNNPEFVYGLVANAQLALPTVPIDPRARGDKLAYFLSFADCAALITADYVVADEEVAQVIARSGVRPWVVSTPEGRALGLECNRHWPVLNSVLDDDRAEPDMGERVDDLATPWLLAYTSGTTGDPKAIEFNHDRLLFYRRLPRYFGYRPDDVAYTGLSITHGNALIGTMMPAVWGMVDHSVLSRWFTRTRLWDVCIAHGVTTWSNLGGIATAIYSEPSSERDRAHGVRLVISAGMPREIWRAFEERFGVKVLEWYGTMEGGFAYNPIGVGPVGSFGKPPEGLVDMDVVDDEGRTVPAGQLGELVVRPAGGEARLSYYKNPEASARKVRNGWLFTGDMVTRDPRGWLYFAHRREEGGLRKAGEFISEGFIRRVLAEDPDVVDVHVYGVPSRAGAPGETDVVAAVVARDAGTFDVDAVFARCAARLERSHVPDFIQVVDDLPRTASEKVQARFLAGQVVRSAPNVFARPAPALHP